MTDEVVRMADASTEKSGGDSFPVVAIGASAGGLSPLEHFFDNVPTGSGMAFLAIQHIGPGSRSLMGEILRKYTTMRVVEVTNGLRLEPDCIYLNPPGMDVGLSEGRFQLSDPAESRWQRLPINYFFRSLAADRREKAICVILSGTGSDGSMGLKAVKEAGGLAIVQDPAQAEYDGMPRSAIATGLVDMILPVERMPSAILDYIRQPHLGPRQPDALEDQTLDTTARILLLVRSITGHDFTQYKQKTIHRRIERRMALQKHDSMEEYLLFLRGQPDEAHLLFREFLIGVTSFFRDAYAFETLKKKVVPEILREKPPGQPVRIWVPACSTGEEAVSLAIIFTEVMEKTNHSADLQVFGTDIDPEAIERARRAEYPEGTAADVSKLRLSRFFTRDDRGFRVKDQIREKIVFAVQNVAADPPFSKLDLLSCRNLLIYLDSTLQKKIFPLFHFTLSPGGYLFLAPSESIGEFSHLFQAVDVKSKIFRSRTNGVLRPAPRFSNEEPASSDSTPQEALPGMENANQMLDSMILEDYAPATVLVDDRYEALFFRGPVDRYFKVNPGEASLNVLRLASSSLAQKLPAALHRAKTDGTTVQLPGVLIRRNGEVYTVDLTVRPIAAHGRIQQGLYAIVFQERTRPVPTRRRKHDLPAAEKDPLVTQLEQELQQTRESLQSTVEEFHATNEELKSANEELQATNEEAQSTNEELVTAKEELQSTNEELMTLNSELQAKIEEVNRISDDVRNLIDSTGIGSIFLDGNLAIKYFTPTMRDFFNLISSDEGRSIGDITSRVGYHSLQKDAESVLRSLQARETQVESGNGKWFSIRILPYRTRDNVIDGVVVTFSDITRLKGCEFELTEAKDLSGTLLDMARDPMLILDEELRVLSMNQAFSLVFGVSAEDSIGKKIYSLGNGRWNHPELHNLLEKELYVTEPLDDFRLSHNFLSAGSEKMLISARMARGRSGSAHRILLAFAFIRLEDAGE